MHTHKITFSDTILLFFRLLLGKGSRVMAVAGLLLAFPAKADWVPGYSYKTKLVIESAQVCGSSPHSNFPLLIRLSGDYLKTAPDGQVESADGYDIIFTASDGTTVLDHQIDYYDGVAGEYGAWVKIPSLSPSVDTEIYIYYGNAAALSDPSTTDTWDAHFRTVYHFQDDDFSDATANNVNSTNIGTTSVPGYVGEGRSFNGIDQYIQTNSSELATADNFTISAWIKANATSPAHIIWQGESGINGWGTGPSGGEQEMHLSIGTCCPASVAEPDYVSFFLGDREEQLSTDGLMIDAAFTNTTDWVHLAATVVNLSTAPVTELFVNGVSAGTNAGVVGAVTNRSQWDTNLRIGRPGANERYFNGWIDEVRISNAVLSPDWFCTEHNNVSDPGSFISITYHAPELDNIESLALEYAESDPATAITSAITVEDWDNANLTGATIRISAGYQSSEDVLVFTNANGITGVWDAPSGTLTLSGSSSVNNYQLALRSITYENTNTENPNTSQRAIEFIVTDGTDDSDPVTRNITINAVNDEPELNNIEGAALNYAEGSGPELITNSLEVADVDNANLAGATIRISAGYQSSEDVLAFTNANGITGTWDAPTGTLTLSGSSSVSNYQLALRSITYENTNTENPNTTQRTIEFIVTDGTDDSDPVTRNITINAVNDEPELNSIEGAALSYTEGVGAVAITSLIEVSDVDNVNLTGATIRISAGYQSPEDVLAFTNANGITGTWDAPTGTLTLSGSSSVSNYQLALRSITYENTNTENPNTTQRTIEFIVTDGTDDSDPVSRNITISAVNDEPELFNIEGSALSYTEGVGAVAISSLIEVGDVDNVNLAGATIRISAGYQSSEDVLAFTNANGITGTWDAPTGTLTLSGSSSVNNYQLALRSITYENTNTENPNTTQRTIEFIVTDGTDDSDPVSRNITISAVNDEPELSNIEGAALSYTEGVGAVAITSLIEVSDVDNVNLTGATIRISAGYQSSEDVLAFTNANGISGSWDAPGGTLTLSGSSSVSNYQLALRSITYENTNTENPNTGQRTIEFIVTDGAEDSDPVSRNITISAVNDEPELFNIEGAALSYTEGTGAVAITSLIEVSDVDNVNLAGATIRISAGYQSSEDVLAFASANGITGTWDAPTGTLALSGSSSVSNYQLALRSITYENTNTENPNTTQRTIEFIVTDGTDDSDPVTRNITINAVNDEPELFNIEGSALSYTEGVGAVAITGLIEVSDVDNANLAGATIRISAGYQSSEDVLAFTNANGITGTWDAPSGTLTLSGSSSVSNYQLALRSITYENTNTENPNTTQRTIEFTVTDGTEDSDPVTRVINITLAANIPPSLDNLETTGIAFTPGGAAVVITETITVADSDHTFLSMATVAITSGFNSSEDILTFADANGIAGSFDTPSGVLTLTGLATPAQYETAIRSVRYQNSNPDNPDLTPRILTITVSDGEDQSNSLTREITFEQPVVNNEAPILANVEADQLSYLQGQEPTVISATITVTDPDGPELAGAVVQITENYQVGEDGLLFDDAEGITGVWDQATGVLTLTGVATIAQYQTALRSVQYVNANDVDPSETTRTVAFTVDDGIAVSNTVSRDIDVIRPEEEAPDEILVSQGFSPNGDGINDTWSIEGIEYYPNNRVQIFNRWGSLVFELKGYNTTDRVWGGESNRGIVVGADGICPDGTYFYTIDLGNGSKVVSGFVVVNK